MTAFMRRQAALLVLLAAWLGVAVAQGSLGAISGRLIDPNGAVIVNVDATIYVKNTATGEEIDMTFVGPWDADLATHRYNYLAPFAQQMMGKTVGERIEIDLGAVHGQFEVLSIENGLT